MTSIIPINITLQNLKDNFADMTPAKLDIYKGLTHDTLAYGGDIFSRAKGNYLYILNEAICKREYSIINSSRIPTMSTDEEVGEYWTGKLKKRAGLLYPDYTDKNGKTIEIHSKPIPIDSLRDLESESELVLNILENFKKIRWALDIELRGSASQCEDLGKSSAEYIELTCRSIKQISDFYQSNKIRAFVMGSPNRPSISASNLQRNLLTRPINYWIGEMNIRKALQK